MVRLQTVVSTYLHRVARPLLAQVVAERVDADLQGNLEFASANTMDAADEQTQMLDVFVAGLIRRMLSPEETATLYCARV